MISQDTLLADIWMLTGALALVSLVILFVLVLRRAFATRQARRDAARRAELMTLLNAALDSPVPIDSADLPRLSQADHPIVLHIALDMIRAVRGAYVDEIIALVARLGLFDYLKTEVSGRQRNARINALTLLGYFPPDESAPVLMAQMQAADPYVQLAALRGLARHTDAIDPAMVLRAFGSTPLTNTPMLADVFGRFGPEALPALHELVAPPASQADRPATAQVRRWPWSRQPAVRGRVSEAVRVAAIIAIGTIGALASVDILRECLQDASARVRGAAAEALGRLGDDAVAGHVARLLNDPVEAVRIKAAEALGRLQATMAMPELAAALEDASWWVRFRAAESLFLMGSTGVAVLRAKADEAGTGGEIATQVLAEMAAS